MIPSITIGFMLLMAALYIGLLVFRHQEVRGYDIVALSGFALYFTSHAMHSTVVSGVSLGLLVAAIVWMISQR